MRLRPLLLNLALTAGLLLAAEGWCSLGEKLPKYRPSYTLGYELAPGYIGRRETVNLQGLRGAEIGPKRPGSFRILAMGGSTTWGHKVDDDETWPVALERELRAATGRDVEVLNGGVSGYDLEHVVTALHERYLSQLQPDLVVVNVGWNLPLIDSMPMQRMRAQILAAQRRDGLHRSALVRQVARAVTEWREEKQVDASAQRPSPEIVALRAQRYPPLYAQLRRLCDEQGVAVVALRYPCLIQRPPPTEAGALASYEVPLRNTLGGDHDVATLVDVASAQWLAGLDASLAGARLAGIPVLDLAARLEAELPAADADTIWSGYFRDHAHFTPAGDAAFGHALAGLLLEQELLPAR